MTDQSIRWPGHPQGHTSPLTGAEKNKINSAVVLPEANKTLRAFGDEISIHTGGAETGGKYTIFTCLTPPGGGPPPHYHNHEDEWFFVLDGKVEFLIDGSWQEVPPGSLVYLPRGTIHTFRNCGDKPLKMLTQTAPSGFEIFFERCAEEFAKPGPPNMDRIIKISSEHGIHYVMD
jgi:quercetin dioxygenase-like cupin family protein